MTTTTASGFSRTIDYDTGTYSDFETTRIEFIRQDGDDSFVYHYNWIDDTGVAPPMAQILDPWSH